MSIFVKFPSKVDAFCIKYLRLPLAGIITTQASWTTNSFSIKSFYHFQATKYIKNLNEIA